MTGQTSSLVRPRTMVVPVPNGSVLLRLRKTETRVGWFRESIEISEGVSVHWSEGQVNSPERKIRKTRGSKLPRA